MRRIRTCIVLSALLAALVLGANRYVADTLDSMQGTLRSIQRLALMEEYEQAAVQCRRLEDTFDKNERMLSLFLRYDLLGEAGNAVHGILGYACADNRADLTLETNRALQRLQTLGRFYFSVY